jgi:uncharacterized protein (DUF1778 family)
MVIAQYKNKEERLSIRISGERKALIAKAAKIENRKITDFVLENAVAAAEAVVSDDAEFHVSGKQWKKLVAALDAPPRKIPALRKLLTQPSVFDAK